MEGIGREEMGDTYDPNTLEACMKFSILFHMYECFAYMYVCAPRSCSAFRGQKRAENLLKLELQMVVSHHTGAGTPNQIL